MVSRILDSFTLVAYLEKEPGGVVFQALLELASDEGDSFHMSVVNYAEVKYRMIKGSGLRTWPETEKIIAKLPIVFHPADKDAAEIAANFKAKHKMSLADTFAAALAKKLDLELITGDPEFSAVQNEIKIYWIPQR